MQVRPQAAEQRHRARDLTGWLLLFAAACAVRSLRFGFVWTPGGVRFPSGADELYHMRRIWFTVVNFPASLDFDPYLNHPEGARAIWTPVFDWSIAAVARLLVGAGDQAAVERVAIWAPPLLGALGVLAAAWLARRTFSAAAGWVTGAWLAVLPAHTYYGNVGEVDHHVAIGLLATLLVAAAMRLAGPLAPAGRPRGVFASGAAIAAGLLLWPGLLLHVIVVQACWALQLLATRAREPARARAAGLAAAHALAAGAVAPFCVGRGSADLGAVTPLVLSNFQPLWLGAGALLLGGLAALWGRTPLGATRARRLGAALALAGLGVAAAWLAVPGLAEAVRNAAGWFTPDPFLARVAELEPMLMRAGRFDPTIAHHYFSYAFWLFPVAAAALAWRAARDGRHDVLLLVAWASVFAAAALAQQRFTDAASTGYALVLAAALVAAFRAARAGWLRSRPRRLVAAAAAACVALAPYAPAYRGDLLGSLALWRGERVYLDAPARRLLLIERVARWLHDETPPTAGYLDPTQAPAWGVLAPWGFGHLLRYYAERPLVQDNFGPWGGRNGFERARAYFDAADEEAAFAIASRLRARYVVAGPQGSGQRPPGAEAFARRLALRPGAGGPLLAAGPERALARHRLVFVADGAELPGGGARPLPLALYEVVAGAEVAGAAPPAARVDFELRLALPPRAPLRYRASTRADASGRYAIRLPQPSESPYRVRAAGQTASLVLSEADVREGRAVAGPNFEVRAIPPP